MLMAIARLYTQTALQIESKQASLLVRNSSDAAHANFQ